MVVLGKDYTYVGAYEEEMFYLLIDHDELCLEEFVKGVYISKRYRARTLKRKVDACIKHDEGRISQHAAQAYKTENALLKQELSILRALTNSKERTPITSGTLLFQKILT